MKPTKAWVEKTVRLWQDRLGLVEWMIVVDWDKPANDGALATVWKSDDYLVATICFGEGFAKETRQSAEQILVHEMLHVHLRNLSRVNDAVFSTLEDEASQTIARNMWVHAEEALVDRLAESLVRTWPR